MMRTMKIAATTLVLSLVGTAAAQQQEAPPPPPDSGITTLSVRSTLVLVPALVKTKAGEMVYTLKADDFHLTDNGIPQKLSLEDDAGAEPLALVILVETGGDGADKLDDYSRLGALLDAVVGGVEHKVAVVTFDSAPTVVQNFTSNVDRANHALANVDAGDKGAAIYDGLSFAVEMLRRQPPRYRRAILMFSETIDHGSKTSLIDTLHAIGDTNTTVYAVAFNSSKAQVGREASKLSSAEPGPEHGCFARDPNADPPIQESRATQNYDCIAELLPPLRLAKMAFIAMSNSMRRNVPESVTRLTGGEYFKFRNVKTLEHDLLTISNHIPNRYVLSFRPTSLQSGFHTIELSLPDHADLKVEARNGYWIDEDKQEAGSRQ